MFHAGVNLPGLRKLCRMSLSGRTSIYRLQNYTPASLRLLLEQAGFRDILIRCENELSQPVWLYVRAYLTRKLKLPDWAGKCLAPSFWPILRGPLNPNKVIVVAKKE